MPLSSSHPHTPSSLIEGQGEGAPLSRREARRQETHEALVSAAMTLLATKGFEETTTDEIAQVAGVSRRTLFRYFPTKADIVTAWAQQMTDVLRAHVAGCPAGTSPQAMLCSALEAVVPHMAQTPPEAYAFVYLIERTPALLPVSLRKYAQWEDSLADALSHHLTDQPDSMLAARVAARSGIAAFRTAIDEWIRLKGRQPLVPIMRKVMTLQASILHAP